MKFLIPPHSKYVPKHNNKSWIRIMFNNLVVENILFTKTYIICVIINVRYKYKIIWFLHTSYL